MERKENRKDNRKYRKKKIVYVPIIQSIIEDFKRRRKYLPENLGKTIPFHNYSEDDVRIITERYKTFANHMYQTVLDNPAETSLAAFVFEQVMKNQKKESSDPLCTQQLLVDGYYQVIRYNGSPEDMNNKETWWKIADDLIQNSDDCKFFVIDVGIMPPPSHPNSGHSNVIFCEFTGSKIILNCYEPLNKYQHAIEQVLYNLSVNHKGIIYNENLRSGEGAQKYAKDDAGYCVMFSLFWLYIVLNIVVYNINHDSYVLSKYWIEEVEKYYISMLQPKELFEIVITFGISLMNDFLAENPVDIKKMTGRLLDQFRSRYYKSVKEKPIQDEKSQREDEKERKDYYSRRELIKLSKENPEYTYETWENARLKEENLMKQAWKKFLVDREINPDLVYTSKLKLGTYCSEDQECFSGKCKHDEEEKESYCVP